MYLTRFLFLFWWPSVFSYDLNATRGTIVDGYEPSYDNDVADIPRFLQKKGRKHCFKNRHLFCKEGKKCCTHVHQKKIWCCDKKDKCGSSPKTCRIL